MKGKVNELEFENKTNKKLDSTTEVSLQVDKKCELESESEIGNKKNAEDQIELGPTSLSKGEVSGSQNNHCLLL